MVEKKVWFKRPHPLFISVETRYKPAKLVMPDGGVRLTQESVGFQC